MMKKSRATDRFPNTLLVFMPVYNEEEALSQVIHAWAEVCQAVGGDLLLISDGSKDGSVEIIKGMQGEYPFLRLIDRENRGHGATCLEGYQYAVDNGYEWVFQTDSDGQTRAIDFYPLWENRSAHPFLFGKRRNRGDGRVRDFISLVLRLVIKSIFGVWVEDANVPFRLMRVEELEGVIAQVPEGFFLANALVTVIIEQAYRIKWFDISFAPREGGAPSVQWSRYFSVGHRVVREFRQFRSGH